MTKILKNFLLDFINFINEAKLQIYKEIYMEQPKGFLVKVQENKVYKLVKSLNGLKQALKHWHEKFDYTMLTQGFYINKCDK